MNALQILKNEIYKDALIITEACEAEYLQSPQCYLIFKAVSGAAIAHSFLCTLGLFNNFIVMTRINFFLFVNLNIHVCYFQIIVLELHILAVAVNE
jgi:hypothetical protein